MWETGLPGPSGQESQSRIVPRRGLWENFVCTSMPSRWWTVPGTMLFSVCIMATAADRAGPPKKPPLPGPAKARPTAGRILLMRGDGFALLNPDGKELLAAKLGPEEAASGWGWLSPDGKRMAYLIGFGNTERQPRVMVRDLDGGKFATAIDVNAMYLLWNQDGRSLVATSYLAEPWSPLKTEHVSIDLDARTVSNLRWPDNIVPVDRSADGKTVVVIREGKTRPTGHLCLMTSDGKQITELTTIDASVNGGIGRQLSPDGKKLLFSDTPPEGKDDIHGMSRRLYVLDISTKKKMEVAWVPLNATVLWSCWSPDGRRIAYTWRQRHAGVVKALAGKLVPEPADLEVETETFLIVADADGSNAKTIASAKTNNALEVPFQAIRWR
jgi:hypothetical protein